LRQREYKKASVLCFEETLFFELKTPFERISRQRSEALAKQNDGKIMNRRKIVTLSLNDFMLFSYAI
jgi:hypothetical protein